MSATRATASDVVRVTLSSMATAYSAGRMPSDGRMKRAISASQPPAVLVVIHMQVHDGADPRLARPGEEALVVLLDEADRSVDELRTVLAQIRPHGGKQRGERGARHIELADHFRAFHLGL